MPGVGLMVRVVGLGSCSAVGVDSACQPSEVGKNECQLAGILCWSGYLSRIVPISQGDCLGSINALHSVWSQWMDGWMDGYFWPYLSMVRNHF